MKNLSVLFVLFFLTLQPAFAQELQSPQDFLGYEIGTRFTRHADLVKYFEYVAKNSGLVQYHTYGKTNEFRPLTYAVISSEENLKDLEKIRTNHLKNAGISSGPAESSSDKAIVWLSYNVHGNEASGTEAAMQTLYAVSYTHLRAHETDS